MKVPLLSPFFFGSVEHYRLLSRNPAVIIDIGEHYVRQSYRTRTSIAGPNGRQDLVVPVVHDHGKKTPMHAMQPSYATPWPRRHLHALRTAYGKAPWTIHYLDAIEALLLEEHDRLVDLDLASMRLCMEWLRIDTIVRIATEHVPGSDDELDLRTTLHPKKEPPIEVAPVTGYPQVFADRHGFVPRMSILDLLFNAGPEAGSILRA